VTTLQYTWAFGDGSPSATGGPSVLHAYASPSTYTATLTVCDKNGACASDARDVVVTKRDTTTAYLGDTTGTFDTAASLGASLVDEYGQTVNGRSIAFQVGGDAPLSALTNFYHGSSSSNGFAVAKKATTTAYTGAVTGGANKTIVLSAVLKDATGKPLAGRTIAFQLGDQTAIAVTNSSGVAATSLKLNQKNGTYTVSATYAPSAGDDPFYLGSSQGAVFKLQAK
jgi:PKD repeat protein